jgi:hypothetical protein
VLPQGENQWISEHPTEYLRSKGIFVQRPESRE